MSLLIRRGSTRKSDDTLDEDTDDKDDTKRKSRNLSEKKRRDQFNMLINELNTIVSTNSRKMDKSTILKSTISFLKKHNEVAVQSRTHEIEENWKPSFLSNEEFTHLVLEALDGFIMVFSASGRIFYASESITSLLGHLANDVLNMTIYDMVYEEDQSTLYNMFLNPSNCVDDFQCSDSKENQVSFSCRLKRGGLGFREDVIYELVEFVGYFRTHVELVEVDNLISNRRFSNISGEADTRLVFIGTGRLQIPLLIPEMSVTDSGKSEFTSRHSLEWKFLFLDHRAPPIIGYLPFEVLGTSGYDYYHVDDLEKVVKCHKALMQKGEGTSCHYRFLTKGQQWIWLQTRFYITYHQWNSKPEFIACSHRVLSYVDVMKQLRKGIENDRTRESGVSVGNTHIKPLQLRQPQRKLFPQWFPQSQPSDLDKQKENYQKQGHSLTSESPHKRQEERKEQKQEQKAKGEEKEKGKEKEYQSPQQQKQQQPQLPQQQQQNQQIQEAEQAQSQTLLSPPQQHQQHLQLPQQTPQSLSQPTSQSRLAASAWSSKSSAPSASVVKGSRSRYTVHGPGSGSTLMSADSPSSRHSQVTSHSLRSRAGVQGVQVLGKPLHAMAPPQQVTPSATFVEPRQQCVTAIPVQPGVAAGFSGTTAVMPTQPSPELLRQPLVMTTAQSQIQEQLQRKHEELQQLIVQQQEELRRVSEQLLMARYGLLPPMQMNVTLPYSTGAVSSTTNSQGSEGVACSNVSVPVSSDLFVGHSSRARQHPQATSIMGEPHQMNRQTRSSEEVIPFQLSQQQAQHIFSSPNSTQHHQ